MPVAVKGEYRFTEGEVCQFLDQYIETMLWTEGPRTDENDDTNFLDAGYDASDLSDELREEIASDVNDFLASNAEVVEECRHLKDWYTMGQAGHDFALTRNHHGAGFWDRGLGEAGDLLTEASHAYGEAYFYLGDDGRIYG